MLSAVMALMLQAGVVAPAQAAQAAAAPPAPGAVTAPDWIRRPSPEDVARVYPNAAQGKELPGRATISCQVRAPGTLADCAVIEEFPVGEGFGEAAVRLGAMFKMRPITRDGQPVDGGVVRIPIRFVLPGRIDPLSAMLACYGQAAAAAQKNPSDVDAMRAFAFYAAQAAMRQMQAKGTPEAFEGALSSARRAAAANGPSGASGPSLKECLEAARQNAPK